MVRVTLGLLFLACAAGCGPQPDRTAPARARIEPEAQPRPAKARDASDGARDEAATADGGAAPAAPGERRVCWKALGGDRLHEGNEDPTSFDLAFSTVVVAGLAPIEVAGEEPLPDFVDGDERIEAPPGATKVRLRSPVKAWFHGPAVQHCEVVPAPAGSPRPPARAAVPGGETRAWARGLRVGGALLHAGRVPRAVAAELAPLIEAARGGTKLRWVRAIAPPEGEAGPPLLVASHRDRRPAPSSIDDAGVTSSVELTIALLHDDGRAYGLVDAHTARMRSEDPWQLAPSLRVDGDPHPDTVLVAPVLDGETVTDGVLVASTGALAISHIPLFPRDDPESIRDATCFGRVEGRPALLLVRDGRVDATVADARGHFVHAPTLWSQILAYGNETDTFTPVHSNDGGRIQEGPLDPAELRVCPAGGEAVDLPARVPVNGMPGGDTRLVRAHRLAVTKAAVGRQAGLLELTRPVRSERP